jgi:hypothetical protein
MIISKSVHNFRDLRADKKSTIDALVYCVFKVVGNTSSMDFAFALYNGQHHYF